MSREPGSPVIIKILVPSMDKVDALFAHDLAQMMALTAAVMPFDDGHGIGLEFNIGTYIHRSRTELLQSALEEDCTHVLWLDSDMRFPPDSLIRLLKHEVSVVGINYSKRRMPPEFVAVEKIPWGEGVDDADGKICVTGRDDEGLIRVDGIGFGMVLMETAPMVNLPDPRYNPWFWFDKTPSGRMIGEDIYFCKFMLQDRLELPIYVDQDLSKECAHVGQFEFKCYHAEDVVKAREEIEREMKEQEEV